MSAYYPLLKHLHMLLALLSLAGVVLRGAMMWRGSPLLRHPLTRTLPHVNDTLLLLFGLMLLWFGPWVLASAGWLQLKLLLLLVYIGLGFIALHRGRFSRVQRISAWLAAVLVFAVMLWLARFKAF
ncbi:MAG TPA: SirB2 family protein [Gammaproteobacteria bacterium]